MAMTAHDLLLDADAFRAAYPSWPHPEPERKDRLDDRAGYDDTPSED